jgi:hypothetical protein
MPSASDLDALRLLVGFEMALYTRDDVTTWVFAEVNRHEVIPDALLELTVLAGKHDVDIANLLRALVPGVSSQEKAKLKLGTLNALVERELVSLHEAMIGAARIADEISWETYGEAVGLEDAYALAEQGMYGNVADVERDIRAFLGRFALPRT